eukprot:5082427-Pyramimonas_sp.AAC.1
MDRARRLQHAARGGAGVGAARSSDTVDNGCTNVRWQVNRLWRLLARAVGFHPRGGADRGLDAADAHPCSRSAPRPGETGACDAPRLSAQ